MKEIGFHKLEKAIRPELGNKLLVIHKNQVATNKNYLCTFFKKEKKKEEGKKNMFDSVLKLTRLSIKEAE